MRAKITLQNLLISQAIILSFLVFSYLTWFPYSLSQLSGFKNTALTLIGVDLVLGPLLVFIVYKKDKKYLSFDINVLLAIQLSAFLYGGYALFLQHPAYIVFSVDRFTLVNIGNLYPQPSWHKQLKTSFFTSPQFVIVKQPEITSERNKLFLDIMVKGKPDIDKRPKYYQPINDNIDIVLEKSIKVKHLFYNEKQKKKLHSFIKEFGGKPSDYAYLPLKGNNKKDVIWVFSKQSKKPIGIIDSDPWPLALSHKPEILQKQVISSAN